MNKLDQAATGKSQGSGLMDLAESAAGYGGTQDSYSGSGVGPRTKSVGSGGEGSSFVGISGIKTKGRQGDINTEGQGLGQRGELNIDIGTDDIDAEGEIDRAAILKVIRNNKIRFDRCYQFVLQQQSDLQGAIRLQWTILPDGQVRESRALEDQVGSSRLVSCISNVIRSLRFPQPPSGQIPRVSYKFIFSI